MIAPPHSRLRCIRLAALISALTVPALTAAALAASGPAALAASRLRTEQAGGSAGGGPAVLAAGQTGSRAQVPWGKVGPGWVLTEFDATTPPDSGRSRPGPSTLYLIDPRGGRYQLYRWAAKDRAPSLLDWSGDKTRALLGITPARLEQITLATGKTSVVKLPASSAAIGYTRPDGAAILAGVTSGNRTEIGRYSLQGQLETQLAGVDGQDEGAIQSADGAQLVAATLTGLELVSDTGQVIRSLPVRTSVGGCATARYWDAGTVLAACGTRNSGQRLWLVPLSGQLPTAFTPVRSGRGADLGDLGAWQLRTGTYLQATGPCGDEFIARKLAGGGISVIRVPGAAANDNHILSASGNRLLVQAETGCTGSDSLLWFNPATHAEQWLLRAPHGEQGVTEVVPFYSRLNQNFFF